jgi:hypothetical protein
MSEKKSYGSLFCHFNALTIFILFCFTVGFQAKAETGEEYSVIDWKDLVPVSWRRPLIDPDPTENHHVDVRSLASKLDKQNIKLAGYMLPIKFTSNVVSEFILMPYLKHHVKIHAHHEPNQMIYVKLSQPLELSNPYSPIWVSGQLVLKSVDTPEGHTGYTLKKASTEEYLY